MLRTTIRKLAATSDEDAQRSLDRLDTLEKNKPTPKQLARYAALGAATGTSVDALKTVIKKDKFNPRGLAASALGGAITTGAVPLLRTHMDRRAEIGTLKNYINEHAGEQKMASKKIATQAAGNLFDRLFKEGGAEFAKVAKEAFLDEWSKIAAVMPANVIRGIAPKVPAAAPKLGPAVSAKLDSMGIKKLPTAAPGA